MNQKYLLKSESFSTLAGFYDEIGRLLLPNDFWGKNLDALNDILAGGFNIPESPFELIWDNVSKAKQDLGFEETENWYKRKLEKQPENQVYLLSRINEMRDRSGETLYDMVFEILAENSRSHEVNGDSVVFKM
jgi:RNAse (barnase) inhibitor barstar